jgi:exodeoxyribonuclease V alpha subunit
MLTAVRMKLQPEPSTQEVLAGLIERVTYHNEDNGFCVLRIKARGHRELITVVGHAAVISAGEWSRHRASGSMTALTASSSRPGF